MILTLQQETQLFQTLQYSLMPSLDINDQPVVPVNVPKVLEELVAQDIDAPYTGPLDPDGLAALIRIWNLIGSLLHNPEAPDNVTEVLTIQKGQHPAYGGLASNVDQEFGSALLKPLGVADLVHALLQPVTPQQVDDYFERCVDLGYDLSQQYLGGTEELCRSLYMNHLMELSNYVNHQIVQNRLFL